MNIFATWIAAIALLLKLALPAAAQGDGLGPADGFHHLALQISDGDPGKMTEILDVAANVSRYYSGIGEEIEIRVIVFAAGIKMLREDRSPVRDRLKSFSASMPNVTFVACQNTIDTVEKREGPIPIVATAERVQAGVVELITLHEQGWTIVRP